MYGVSMGELRATNNLTSDTIKIGQQLVIVEVKEPQQPINRPEPKPRPAPEEPKPGKPAEVKPAPAPKPAPAVPPPAKKAHEYYTLQAGETIESVCKKFGTTKEKLKAINKNQDMDTLKAGDEIRVK
jgi:LysM repeat protein